ncbi:LCP family protein [Modestobacter sp. VKM Ac-2985]|uniref:LCP family protein n=1 Tax=Modestobacter sp. VKM Ac-2985 TaxID=3004139 RepID=UPI0022AB705C|nr:LCP family protein [Modestobacter sp. VKM Ac-2985]MCZ2838929.1 LCP family protein [Modestobacter sp. VKM Ac-2985]
MTRSTTANAGQAPPGRRSPRSRAVRWALLVTAVLVLAVTVDAAVLTGRIDRAAVTPTTGPGTTWVLVGVDSRAELPAGASAEQFGTTDQVPGARADVVLVVHSDGDSSTVFSVPRDLVLNTGETTGRLALSWLDGPQATVDALCHLGVATDHLVSVDLAGFAAVVDAAGGLSVDVPIPVRDPVAGLELTEAGRQQLDGRTALAMVRSRQPEHRVDGEWVPAPIDPDGRASAAGQVVDALADRVQESLVRPWRLQRVAWAATDALTVDHGTSLPDLAWLARADLAPVSVLPVGDPVNDTLLRFPSPATATALSSAGMSCDG